MKHFVVHVFNEQWHKNSMHSSTVNIRTTTGTKLTLNRCMNNFTDNYIQLGI